MFERYLIWRYESNMRDCMIRLTGFVAGLCGYVFTCIRIFGYYFIKHAEIFDILHPAAVKRLMLKGILFSPSRRNSPPSLQTPVPNLSRWCTDISNKNLGRVLD